MILALMMTTALATSEGEAERAPSFTLPQAEPAAAPAAAPIEEEKPKPHFAGFDWEGTVTAGLTYTTGNSKTANAAVDVGTIGRTEDDRITFGAGYLGARQEDPNTGDSSSTARRYSGSLKYDRFLTEKWYAYVQGLAERDDIKKLNLLWNAGGGAGYQWIDRDERHFNTEAGIGYTDQNFDETSGNPTSDTAYVAARAAMHYDTKIGARAEFFHDSEWLPSLEDFSEDQIVHTATGIRAGIVGNLSLEAKVIWDWLTNPAPGQVRQDVTYVFGLTWSF